MRFLILLSSITFILSQTINSVKTRSNNILNKQHSIENRNESAVVIGLGFGNKTESLADVFKSHVSVHFEYNRYFGQFVIAADMVLIFHTTKKDNSNSTYNIKEKNGNSFANFHGMIAYELPLFDRLNLSPSVGYGLSILSESNYEPNGFGPAKLSSSFGLHLEYELDDESTALRLKYQVHNIDYGKGAKGAMNTIALSFVKFQ